MAESDDKEDSVSFSAFLIKATSNWRVLGRALVLFAGVIMILCLGGMLAMVGVSCVRPPIRVVSQDSGATVFTVEPRGEHQWATFMLTPNAGSDGPWVDTEIPIQAGDKVTVRASGHVCLAIHHLVAAANTETDPTPPFPWTGPEGLLEGALFRPHTPREEERNRAPFRLAPTLPMGRLIGIVSAGTPVPRPAGVIDVGRKASFEAAQTGTLWLTVNEIWLDAASAEAYAPHTAEEFEANIRSKGYWNVWYDDNVGAFLVNAETNR